MPDPVAAVFAAARRVVDQERRDESLASYQVGFEKGWMAGYETAERDGRVAVDPPEVTDG